MEIRTDEKTLIDTQNKRILHVLTVLCLLFLSIVVYLTYFEIFVKDDILTSSYNRRLLAAEEDTLRGSIYDKNGILLAGSKISGDKQERVYPEGRLYSQVIGYNSRTYGKSLLEAEYNDTLLASGSITSITELKERLAADFSIASGESGASGVMDSSGLAGGSVVIDGSGKEMAVGNSLYLTLDNELQTRASKLLGDRNGAVVVMRPKTGEILAMVSKPDFNPNSAR
ncbi:MAG: hypothetical protein HGA22_05700, partial [Clostridiales bacterium]|nr:hypothetical protein [Clostridiales bacterium]